MFQPLRLETGPGLILAGSKRADGVIFGEIKGMKEGQGNNFVEL